MTVQIILNKNMPIQDYIKLSYAKNLLWTIVFVSLFSFAFACDDLENLDNKAQNHTEALEKYTKSQESINNSLDKIIKSTNGVIVRKLITLKKDKFNNLVNDLKEEEGKLIQTASSTKDLVCKDLSEEDEEILQNNLDSILENETNIQEQKLKVENYIKKDLKKILTDIKEAMSSKDINKETVK